MHARRAVQPYTMQIAKKLRKQNLVAYVLYMYQVEDIVRSYDCDIQKIAEEYLPRFDYDDDELEQALQWYDGLARMIKEEGCRERGHVQVVRNTIFLLTDRHKELLADPEETVYNAAYYKALPFIVELRGKGNGKMKPELETALDAMYGVTLLRMQNKPVGTETAAAINTISTLLNLLAEKYTPEV